MRFLLDQNQSPIVVELLAAVGHEVTHVRDLGLSSASDAQILAVARELGAVIVTGDTDFGDLIAAENAESPSIVLLRRQQGRRGREVGELLLANLPTVEAELEVGAVVVIDDHRMRVRSLPFRPS